MPSQSTPKPVSKSTPKPVPACKHKPVVIFDFDGTLANSFDPALDHLFNEILPKHNLKNIKRADLNKWRNKSIPQIALSLPFSFWKIPQVMLEVKKWHDQNLDAVTLYPEVPKMIRDLNQLGFRLMILTSNSVSNVERVLKRYDLQNEFIAIKESNGLFNKPQALRNIFDDYELTAREVVYVGDEIRDIRACKKVGVSIVAVNYGFNGTKGLRKNKPQYLVNSPQAVVDTVTQICLVPPSSTSEDDHLEFQKLSH